MAADGVGEGVEGGGPLGMSKNMSVAWLSLLR